MKYYDIESNSKLLSKIEGQTDQWIKVIHLILNYNGRRFFGG